MKEKYIVLDYAGYYCVHSDIVDGKNIYTYENDDGKKLIVTVEEMIK